MMKIARMYDNFMRFMLPGAMAAHPAPYSVDWWAAAFAWRGIFPRRYAMGSAIWRMRYQPWRRQHRNRPRPVYWPLLFQMGTFTTWLATRSDDQGARGAMVREARAMSTVS